jgi:hypothetical protein
MKEIDMSQEQPDQPQRANRRQSLRRPPTGKATVTCRKGGLDLGDDIVIGVLNVSRTGVRLLVNCELRDQQEVTLSLESPDGPLPVRAPGHVVWCRPEGEHWEVGIHLQNRLDFRDFLKLTSQS